MAELKKAIRDLAILAIGVLVVDIVFEVTGLALASLNSAVSNLSSYVSVVTLAGVINTLVPIVNVVFIIAAITILLELFGADQILNIRRLIPRCKYRQTERKIPLIWATPLCAYLLKDEKVEDRHLQTLATLVAYLLVCLWPLFLLAWIFIWIIEKAGHDMKM